MDHQYVVGFLFDDSANAVLLIEKQGPEWQKGKLNGIGGKIENHESPREAMVREFEEETGVKVTQWQHFASLGDSQNNRFRVYFYFAFSNKAVSEAISKTDEKIIIADLDRLRFLNTIPNLKWLIPMALSMRAELKLEAFQISEIYKEG